MEVRRAGGVLQITGLDMIKHVGSAGEMSLDPDALHAWRVERAMTPTSAWGVWHTHPGAGATFWSGTDQKELVEILAGWGPLVNLLVDSTGQVKVRVDTRVGGLTAAESVVMELPSRLERYWVLDEGERKEMDEKYAALSERPKPQVMVERSDRVWAYGHGWVDREDAKERGFFRGKGKGRGGGTDREVRGALAKALGGAKGEMFLMCSQKQPENYALLNTEDMVAWVYKGNRFANSYKITGNCWEWLVKSMMPFSIMALPGGRRDFEAWRDKGGNSGR